MSITIHIDFSNEDTRTFVRVPLPAEESVAQALDAAQNIPPSLNYDFEASLIDRGGREVGRVKSIGGVGDGDEQVWAS